MGTGELSSSDALIIALPASGAVSDGARWWRVIDGQITQSGDDLAWLHPSAGGPLADETQVVGLAPAADTVLHRAAFPGLAPRQAEAAARLLAAEQSIGGADTLHVALGEAGDTGMQDVIAVSAGAMARWLAWGQAHGIDFASIVPAALIVDASSDEGTLVRADVAGETILRGRDVAFVADPVLVEHIAGSTRMVDAAPETVEAGMIAACNTPPVELRSGRFARKRAGWFDRDLATRAAVLVGAILVVSLLIAVARIGRTYAEIAGINSAAEADVARALASPPPLDQAIPQLDARLAALGGGPARLSSPLAALVSAMEPATGVGLDSLGWSGDGSLSATLGAPRNEDINPVLLSLQANGYTITATPRAGTDGRALADITVRAGR